MKVEDRPLRRDAEENRQRILAAASELFATRGLGVTLNDIAHHAGVGVGTVYRRYPEKAPLIEELFEQRVGKLVELAKESAEDPDPWRGLTNFFEKNLELQAGDRAFRELLMHAPRRFERIGKLRMSLWPIISGIVDRAQKSGDLRTDFEIQDGPILGVMLGTVIDVGRDFQPDLWRRYLAIVIQGLRADPSRPGRLPVAPLPVERLEEAISSWNER